MHLLLIHLDLLLLYRLSLLGTISVNIIRHGWDSHCHVWWYLITCIVYWHAWAKHSMLLLLLWLLLLLHHWTHSCMLWIVCIMLKHVLEFVDLSVISALVINGLRILSYIIIATRHKLIFQICLLCWVRLVHNRRVVVYCVILWKILLYSKLRSRSTRWIRDASHLLERII